MIFSIFAVLTCVLAAHAFSDTSPFLMFSSEPFAQSHKVSQVQLQSSRDVLNATKAFLGACSSDRYYIVTQPQIDASSLPQILPHLHEALFHKSVKSSLVVAEVLGLRDESGQELVNHLKEKCGAKLSQSFIEESKRGELKVAPLMSKSTIGGWTEDERKLGQSDPGLQSSVLKNIQKFPRYTFILLSTPHTTIDEHEENPLYEPAFSDPVRMDLKRDLQSRDSKTTGPIDRRPLFEKYQFLTPGLFMGLLVGLILIAIFGVGLRAISSLEVSYGAFDREMGPAAHKKQQ